MLFINNSNMNYQETIKINDINDINIIKKQTIKVKPFQKNMFTKVFTSNKCLSCGY